MSEEQSRAPQHHLQIIKDGQTIFDAVVTEFHMTKTAPPNIAHPITVELTATTACSWLKFLGYDYDDHGAVTAVHWSDQDGRHQVVQCAAPSVKRSSWPT